MMVNQLPEWKELEWEAERARHLQLRQEFRQDPKRFQSLSISLYDELKSPEKSPKENGNSYTSQVIFDFSRQLVTKTILDKLCRLARARGLKEKIEGMFSGQKINTTEQRAAMHIALRNLSGGPIEVDGCDVMPEVKAVLQKIKNFTKKIHQGEWLGLTGQPIKNIIAIGIGGSYLGPEFVAEANRVTAIPSMKLRFIANIDGTDYAQKVEGLNPEETLFVVISKTFTTAETMMNAKTSREWMLSRLNHHPQTVARHFVAVSTNLQAVSEFGIDPVNAFGFWDWVGGRFSVCSAVGGLPLSLYLGYENFEAFLAGAHSIDQHFLKAPFEENIPVMLGLLGIWNNNFLNFHSRALLPYCQALYRLAAHIQQVDMESNGKRVNLEGQIMPVTTGPVNFGEPGTNGQHSFYQLIHQGQIVPADFIGFITPQYEVGERSSKGVDHHQELMSNFFAQPDALAFGKTEEELRQEGVAESLIPHKTFPGDRPSSLLLFPKLTPETTGMLLAIYEHRTAVEGFIWGINSFDQWGVELGKVLGKNIRQRMIDHYSHPQRKVEEFNQSTNALLQKFLDGNSTSLDC